MPSECAETSRLLRHNLARQYHVYITATKQTKRRTDEKINRITIYTKFDNRIIKLICNIVTGIQKKLYCIICSLPNIKGLNGNSKLLNY